jgi:hypothetical protein
MPRPESSRTFSLVVILFAGVLTACGDNTLGPDNQLEVTNATDNFQFQVSNMDTISQTLRYTWLNTGTQATIDISQAIASGGATLTISDADGTVVHQEDIANDNDTDTAVGVGGDWTIEVRIQNATGTFNFRVQKKT